MEKLDPKTDGTSQDIVADNIDKLRELFPDAFTEGSDADGPRWKVDFDALKACLGEYVEDERERYSFTWNGKDRARRIAQTPSAGTLRPCPEESVNWDTTQNLFIEGDNLEVLKLLQKSYHKQVKMIYIDPPYNTGGEFIYPDRFQDNLDTYLRYTGQVDGEGFKTSANSESAGRYHTNWLNMMYPRLRLAKNLMTEDGAIFISIDDHEADNLQQICNDIFGTENFVARIVWEKVYTPKSNGSVISADHDYILVYAKSEDFFEMGWKFLPRSHEQNSRFGNPDDDPKGPWRTYPLDVRTENSQKRQKYRYEITTPSGRSVTPSQGRHWSLPLERFEEERAAGRIYFGKNDDAMPTKKVYLHEARDGVIARTWWPYKEVGGNQTAKRELIKLFEEDPGFLTPKPISLIQRMLRLSSREDSIILDFFSGSCSTAEAVYRENALDGGSRRFIVIQLPEKCPPGSSPYEAGFSSIADLGKERIRRAAVQTRDELNSFDLDLGFKVFKLSDSNIVPWAPGTDELKTSLFDSVDNIRHDRSESDVLSELLLKYGLDLAVPIEERDIDGKNVHIIGAGALVVCLADSVDLELVNGIAALKAELAPEVMRVVFKDNGFADDVVKTNAVQILRQAGVEDVKSL